VVRVIVFDLDDTLYPERQYALSAFAAAGQFLEKTRGVAGLGESAASLFAQGARRNVYDLALRSLGFAEENGLVRELVEAHRHHAPAIALSPDAERFISRAERSGFSLALVSDGWLRTQELKVEALSLSGRLNPVILTDIWGREHWKPSPRGFQAVMAQHSGLPAEYIYVGDNPAKDFIAPKALGWRTLRIRRPDGEHYRMEASTLAATAESETTTLDAVDLGALATERIAVSPLGARASSGDGWDN